MVSKMKLQKLFVQLFGGGKAHLKFTDESDPLQAGLEIYATEFVRNYKFDIVIGGEQALTALSFPICSILIKSCSNLCPDEVDVLSLHKRRSLRV